MVSLNKKKEKIFDKNVLRKLLVLGTFGKTLRTSLLLA
jgi:hypothetical protein